MDTRAVETRTETFMVAQNATGEIRTATIVFTLDNLTESVTVTQEALSVPEADKTGMEQDAPELMKNIKIGGTWETHWRQQVVKLLGEILLQPLP